MPTYNHPGVFIEEISTLPPSVAPVSTAIPAFIGYTELAGDKDAGIRPLSKKGVRIRSLFEYETLFGKAANQNIEVIVVNAGDLDNAKAISAQVSRSSPSPYLMYYQVRIYFLNGGGPCYIISIGDYQTAPALLHFTEGTGGLFAAQKIDEITLLLFPDAEALSKDEEPGTDNYHELYKQALEQCSKLKNRVTVIDLLGGDEEPSSASNPISSFRIAIGTSNLSYGAAYYPNLQTTLSYSYKIDESSESPRTVTLVSGDTPVVPVSILNILFDKNYFREAIKQLINKIPVKLPPSGTIAGVYAQIDRNRGVFKAPANVSLNGVSAPKFNITDEDQDNLNIDTSGKSINAIRAFTGKGVLVWGARTLDGNSNEWKYVSVRRFFIFVEESLKKAIEPFVFEPNDITTWTRIKGLIENFLLLQWRSGALAGSTPTQAFVVNIGLGETMTAQDILEGVLKVDVGLAAVRPAEFIHIKFTHKLQEA